jgi:hypothetical protein
MMYMYSSPLQERFYFGDTVLPLFESGIPLLRERLKRLPDADNVIIAYPDEGAWKRFKYQFGDYQEVGLLMQLWGAARLVVPGMSKLQIAL